MVSNTKKNKDKLYDDGFHSHIIQSRSTCIDLIDDAKIK